MPMIATIKAPEQFIVHCDDYPIQFDSVNVTVAVESGDVLESSSAKVSATTSGSVLGIASESTDGTQGPIRVMVRGNPSTVRRESLNYFDSTESTIDSLLADRNIIVVDPK